MSADNMIMLFRGQKHFWVAECQDSYISHYEFYPEKRHELLKSISPSGPFDSLDAALNEANRLINEVEASGGYIEYGIIEMTVNFDWPAKEQSP